MKMNPEQRKLYDAFYNSTIDDGVLDERTELLVGLAAAIGNDCEPCTAFYVKRCEEAGIPKAQMQAVLAKVMAVAAGQKRLQTERALRSDAEHRNENT